MNENNTNGHNFISIPLFIQVKYKRIIDGDQMCSNCGICVNYKYFILNVFDGTARDTINHINDYELSCNEILIKNLLE